MGEGQLQENGVMESGEIHQEVLASMDHTGPERLALACGVFRGLWFRGESGAVALVTGAVCALCGNSSQPLSPQRCTAACAVEPWVMWSQEVLVVFLSAAAVSWCHGGCADMRWQSFCRSPCTVVALFRYWPCVVCIHCHLYVLHTIVCHTQLAAWVLQSSGSQNAALKLAVCVLRLSVACVHCTRLAA